VHEASIGHKFLRGDASLEHLRKQAKKLLKAYQAGDPTEVERVRAQCYTSFLDQTTYAELIAALARPGCLCTFTMEAMQTRSVLDIAMPLVFALLGKEADDERWLTEEEKGRMKPVFHDMIAELQRTWEPVLPTIFGDVQIETDSRLARVTEPDALIVLVGLEITSVQHTGLIPVAYPLPGGIFDLRQHFDRKN